MAWTERYCSPSGGGAHDGTTAADAWTLAEAIAGVAAGHRVNVIAGTYANTTTSRTFGTAGSTTSPIWWRGYNTTIGDIDTDNTLTKPAITFTTGLMTVSAAHQYFSNLDISGAATSGGQLTLSTLTSVGLHFHRVRVENTGANAASSALSYGNGITGTFFSNCWFKASSSATSVAGGGVVGHSTAWHGCVFEGGGDGIRTASTSNAFHIIGCIFYDNGGDGIEIAHAITGIITIDRCTFYSAGQDGIRISATPAGSVHITNSIFANNAGYGINNSTGTNMNMVRRAGNLFYSNSSGTENGFGDAISFNEQSDSATPFTNAGSGDFSLVSSSNAKANGAPGRFENSASTSYLDIGAVQRQEPNMIVIRPRRVM